MKCRTKTRDLTVGAFILVLIFRVTKTVLKKSTNFYNNFAQVGSMWCNFRKELHRAVAALIVYVFVCMCIYVFTHLFVCLFV